MLRNFLFFWLKNFKQIQEIFDIQRELEEAGHEVSMPNSYDEPFREEKMKDEGLEAHAEWKAEMMRRDKENIEPNNAVLVLNFEKNRQPNYIGGATFLEMYKAWELGKRLFLYNDLPNNIFRDELLGMNPTVIYGDLTRIK